MWKLLPIEEEKTSIAFLDPTIKEFSIAAYGACRALAKIKKEVEKCILLCANCYVEVENGVTELSDSVPR